MNKNEVLDYSYPEGFKKAAESLDFLPEEEREGFLSLFLAMLMFV